MVGTGMIFPIKWPGWYVLTVILFVIGVVLFSKMRLQAEK